MKCDGKVLRSSLLFTRDTEIIKPQIRPWDSYSRRLSRYWCLLPRHRIQEKHGFSCFFWDICWFHRWVWLGRILSSYVSAMLLWHGFYYRQKGGLIKLTEICMQPVLRTSSICIELQYPWYKNFLQWILVCADALVSYMVWHSIYTGPTHHFSIF